MLSYLLKRLLLMIPTLLGILTLCFLIMRLAPGDPVESELGSTGSQKPGSVSREQYKAFVKQYGLDKPLFLNTPALSNYSEELDMYLPLIDELDLIASRFKTAVTSSGGDANKALESPSVAFMKNLSVRDVTSRLQEYIKLSAQSPREAEDVLISLSRSTALGIQKRLEKMGKWAMKPLYEKLIVENDVKRKSKICTAMKYASTAQFPFELKLTPPSSQKEIDAAKQSWQLWLKRTASRIDDPEEERKKELDAMFAKVLSLGQEGAQMELDRLASEGELFDSDARYFATKIVSSNDLTSLYYYSRITLMIVSPGKDMPLLPAKGSTPKQIDEIAENWMTLYSQNKDEFEPSILSRLLSFAFDTQYAMTLWRLITFDFGESFAGKGAERVGQKIWAAFKNSFPLMLATEIIVYLIAVPAGILCAVNRGRFVDKGISVILFLLYSIPGYVAALIFLLIFWFHLGWLPQRGMITYEEAQQYSGLAYFARYVWHAFLPVICMSIFHLAGLAMYTRSSMLEVANQDYIRTARAKGVPETWVVLKHILRNGLIPIITLFASFLPGLLGGSIIIETIFDIPGMGKLSIDSIGANDYNTLMALFYIDSLAVLVSFLLTDLLYVLVDPRISFAKLETQ